MASDHDPFGKLSLPEQGQVNTICDEFEEALQEGLAPRLEDCLTGISDQVRDVLFRELLLLECEYSLRQQTDISRSSLAVRFPGREASIGEAIELARHNLARRTSLSAEVGALPGHRADPTAFPETVGRFRLLSLLGHGSFGSVFRAVDTRDGGEVALKVPHVVTLVTPDLRERFLREARVADLDHPRIVKVREVGETGLVCYIASDYVPGTTLSGWLRQCYERHEQVPFRLAARWTELLAGAIQHAHERGVLHCDLKPANILLRDGAEPDPVVTDFGLARLVGDPSELTRSGQFFGTPAYMAPEQATGPRHELSPATDVYGLGAVLYEMLTGRPPFQGTNLLELLDQKRNNRPVSPRVLIPRLPRDLETICLKCLEKAPSRRYASALALAADLQRFLEGKPIEARPVGRAERCWRWCRRKPALAGVTAALILVVLVGLGAVLSLWWQAEASEAQAREGEKRAVELLHQAEAAQRDSENSHATTLRLMHEVLLFVDRTPRQATGQGVPMDMLREVEAQCRLLLLKRPADAKLLVLLSGVCLEQAFRHSAQKQTAQAVQAYRRAARVLEEAEQSRERDHWDHFQVTALWLRVGMVQNGLGERSAALATLRRATRLLQDAVDSQETDPRKSLVVIELFMQLGSVYGGAGEKAATLASFQRAATIGARLAQQPPHKAEDRVRLAEFCLGVGLALRKHGATAESPDQLELARQLFEGLAHEAPGELRHMVRLGDTWYQLGQTRRELKQHDGAFVAYRQAVQAQRKAFDSAPDMPQYREKLSLRYNRLAYWLRRHGCLAEAAASLLEQKKLWPGNAQMLLEISRDLAAVAAAVGGGRGELTPAEQKERRRYLDLSKQVAREAAAPQPKSGGTSPESDACPVRAAGARIETRVAHGSGLVQFLVAWANQPALGPPFGPARPGPEV